MGTECTADQEARTPVRRHSRWQWHYPQLSEKEGAMDGTEVESSAGCLGCFTVPLGDIRSCPRPPSSTMFIDSQNLLAITPSIPFP